MSAPGSTSPPQSAAAAPAPRKRSPFWAKLALLVAVGFMALGIALPLMRADTSSRPAGATSIPGVNALAPGAEAPAESTGLTDRAAETGRSVFFRLGFSFAAAFAIAYAMRMFFNFSIASLGFFLAAMMGLQYAGLIEIKWIAMGEKYDSFTAWLGAHVSSAQNFIKTTLPNSAAAVTGLYAGWRRKL